MKMKFKKETLTLTAEQLLLRAGYARIVDRRSGQESFVRRLGTTGHYPRFHIYINHQEDVSFLNLHLDQRPSVYEGARAHAADYDGPVVEGELERLRAYFPEGGEKKESKQNIPENRANIREESVSLSRDLEEIPGKKGTKSLWDLLKNLWQ